MKWLDLFSGIGMYALGLEQAGHEVIGNGNPPCIIRELTKGLK